MTTGPETERTDKLSWMPLSDAQTAAFGLIAANLVPLVGVIAFGWSLHSLLVAYWLESGAIGTAYIAKIRHAEGIDDPRTIPDWEFNGKSASSFVGASNAAIARFFVGHYGLFWAVHGLFVVVFYPAEFPTLQPAGLSAVVVAAIGLIVYHAVSYRVNYIEGGEYERNGPVTLMVEPYSRVFVLHVTIVIGAIPISWFGAPAGAVAVMVLVKTIFDYMAHKREHERARSRPKCYKPGELADRNQ